MKAPIFANIVVISVALFATSLLFYGLTNAVPIYATFSLIALILCAVISLRLPVNIRINFALLLISTASALLIVELILVSTSTDDPTAVKLASAKNLRIPFDTRSRIQVARDLRADGLEAFAGGNPAILQALEPNGNEVVPIAGISDKLTVYCNETGEFTIYQSDEHGFHNPNGIWGKANIDIVALGDSFVHGACVKSEENTVALIREAHPNTLNLGLAGIGPWEQFAIIKEYVQEIEPKVILWFYYEGNDILNLQEYDTIPLLKRYVDSDYRQGLMDRQDEIDQTLTTRMDQLLKERTVPEKGVFSRLGQPVIDVLTLQSSRIRLRPILGCNHYDPNELLPTFERVLNRSSEFVDAWGGKLYFVYLPSTLRYLGSPVGCWQKEQLYFSTFQDRFNSIAADAGFSIIDIAKVIDAHPDPLSMYPFRSFGHFDADGYELVAETILRSIEFPE